MFSALTHAEGVAVGQRKIPENTGEQAQMIPLLDQVAAAHPDGQAPGDLSGVVVTADALHVHRRNGEQILAMFGPDVVASVTTSELALLARGIRCLDAALASPVDKDAMATELAPMRALFGRSLLARRALDAGHVLAARDVIAKKPAGGIPPARLETLVGRRLRRALHAEEPLREEDLELADSPPDSP